VSHDVSLTHPNLKVVYNDQAVAKERSLFVVEGVAPESSFCVNNSDIRTLKTSLLTRMFFCVIEGKVVEPPKVCEKFVFSGLKPFRTRLLKLVSKPTKVSLEQVVEMYHGRKKTIYQNALVSLDHIPLSRNDSHSLAFVKCEKVNPEKAPRCIQPRKPRYNLVLGRYLKHIEHRVYRGIDKLFKDGPTVIKGYDVRRVARIMCGKWNSFRKPVAVGIDAVKFDMHVSPQILKWEHKIYEALYYGDSYLAQLLSWQMHNVGMGYCEDGKLYYTVDGKRFSGDLNTALGNCLIMCAMVWTYAYELGIPIKLMNNGDDCVIFMESEHLSMFQSNLTEFFLNYGFRMTCEEPCYEVSQIEFCQMHCIRTANGPVMVRNIPTSLSKDAMCTNDLRGAAGKKWFYAVGECGLALTSGVPVMQSFYSMYCRSGVKSRMGKSVELMNSGLRMMRGSLESKVSWITPEARSDVYCAWGITPDAQVALEKHYCEFIIDTNVSRTADVMSDVHNILL
jgi:hypothetical protein